MVKVCPALVQTRSHGRNETIAGALPCQSHADDSYGWVAPKLCGHIGRELKLCRVKAVRTYRALAKAGSRQSRADISDDSYGCVAPKLYGRIER